MRTLILLLFSVLAHAQSDVPVKYWIDDSNFEDTIGDDNAFGDDNSETIVVEFWAKFNEANAFADWDKVDGVKYFRIDVGTAPLMKKKFRIRMAPTIIIFNKGIKEDTFKAGLDLECPVDLDELQENINEISPGQIVLAPFRQRKVVGIIVSEGSKTVSKSKLKTVIDIYELDPIPLPTIDLISFLANWNCVYKGLVLKMVLSPLEAVSYTHLTLPTKA